LAQARFRGGGSLLFFFPAESLRSPAARGAINPQKSALHSVITT